MTTYRDWLVSKIQADMDERVIKDVTALGGSFIEIISQKGHKLVIGVTNSKHVSASDMGELLNDEKTPDIIIGSSKAVWTGGAINYARQNDLGWGGMGEIFAAIDNENVSAIQKKEYDFVEKGLKKHTRVDRLERIFDRFFKIYRTGGLTPLIVTLINEYELTADHIRHASEIYGEYDLVLKTNPYGTITGMAETAAEEVSAEIFMWAALLGRLNKR